ncbi:MAG TPA: HAMP domain-containing sensor histidine kinase [Solirubrobacteraceae bacterium]|jgi:signal transduction histidine kinase|nr:HAMP domain-containing sensor histidine kinase [Solirubrobacteraceae bacterium]
MIAAAGWIAALVAVLWLLRLRSVLGRRAELVARACHELRRPVTVARLGVELASRDGELRPDALRAVDLELASAGVALEDLSAAVTGREGPWRPGAVDVPALLGESVEAFRPLAHARGVHLALHWRGERRVLHADRIRLAQATGNLIANAIEHGEGPVELRGGADEDGRLEISVADGGPGLPARVDDLAGRRPGRGRGRGLAIAAEVAARHGGRLVAASDDEGSRVKLSLPLR